MMLKCFKTLHNFLFSKDVKIFLVALPLPPLAMGLHLGVGAQVQSFHIL